MRPDRFPIFAAGSLPLSQRQEPPGGTSVSGYAFNSPIPASHWNWITNTVGQWERYLDAQTLKIEDVHTPASGVYRLADAPAAPSAGGPLVQPLAVGAVYLVDGERFYLGPDSGPLTYANNTTNYVHIRSRPLTDRSPTPDVLVSTNASEPGYATILEVVTGGGIVVVSTEIVGVSAYLPYTRPIKTSGWLEIEPQAPWNFNPALRVTGAQVSPIVARISAHPSGAGGVLDLVPSTTSSFGVRVQAAAGAAGPMVQTIQTGLGSEPAIRCGHTQGGRGIRVTGERGGGGTGGALIRVESGEEICGIDVDSVHPTAQAPLRLRPMAFFPFNPTDGDVYLLQGAGPGAFRFQGGGDLRQAHSSKDGVAPGQSLTTTQITLGPSTGFTTLVSRNVYFRQNGRYLILVSTLQGGHGSATTLVTYQIRVDGTALPGASGILSDPAVGSAQNAAFPSLVYLTSTFSMNYVYTHSAADGVYSVDLRASTSFGSNQRAFSHRSIIVFTLDS
jgi:hypothetical protein